MAQKITLSPELKSKTLITPVFRVSFMNAFVPRAAEGDDGKPGTPKYGVTAVFNPSKFSPPDQKRWKELLAFLDEVSMFAFRKKVKDLPANFKKALRDGIEKEDLEGFGAGKQFCSLTTKIKPGVVDKDGVSAIVDDPKAFYSGCFARAKVNCYPYDNKSKGLALGLMSLQKMGDGARLDASSNAAKDFAEHEVSAEDEDWLKQQEGAEDAEEGGF